MLMAAGTSWGAMGTRGPGSAARSGAGSAGCTARNTARKSPEEKFLGSVALGGGKFGGLGGKKSFSIHLLHLERPEFIRTLHAAHEPLAFWAVFAVSPFAELCTEAARSVISSFARYMLLSKTGKDSLQNPN